MTKRHPLAAIRSHPRQLLLHLVLTAAAIVMVYPWLIAISTSLKAPGESNQNQGLIPRVIDLGKFADVIVEVDFPRLAFNSVLITGATVALVLLLASLAAYAFARLDFVLKEWIFLGMLVGLMLQTTSLMVPIYQVNLQLHLLNTHLAMIGPYVALALPFAILVLRGFFANLPRELEESAVIDGASPFRIYRSVLLPLTKPALITVGIFVGLAAWNDFLLPMISTSTPDMRTLPLGLLTFIRSDLVSLNEDRFALIVLMTLPVLVLFVLLQRQFIQGITAGAVKE